MLGRVKIMQEGKKIKKYFFRYCCEDALYSNMWLYSKSVFMPESVASDNTSTCLRCAACFLVKPS